MLQILIFVPGRNFSLLGRQQMKTENVLSLVYANLFQLSCDITLLHRLLHSFEYVPGTHQNSSSVDNVPCSRKQRCVK